jgi:hypothetical protein
MTTTFNITPELWQEMRAFSTDSRPRFLYVITHHNPDGSLNIGYSGKKTTGKLSVASTYTGSSTDTLFSKERILSHRSEYQFIIVGYCRSTEELGNSEDALNHYMKRFYKKQWANKKLNGKWTTEGLIPIIKKGKKIRYVRPEELEHYKSLGWSKGMMFYKMRKEGEALQEIGEEQVRSLLEAGYFFEGHERITLHHPEVKDSSISVHKETGYLEEDVLDALKENFILGSAPLGHETTADKETVEKVKKYIEFVRKRGEKRQADTLRAGVGYVLTRGAEPKTVNKDELILLLQKKEGWKITSHERICMHHAKVAGSMIQVSGDYKEADILEAVTLWGFEIGSAPKGHETTADEKTVEKVKKYIEFVWERGRQRMADTKKASTRYTLKKGDEPPLEDVTRDDVLGKLKEDYRFTQVSVTICNKAGYKPHCFEQNGKNYDREKQHQKLIRLLESGDWQLGSVWEEPMLVGEPVVAEIEEPVVAVKYDFVGLMSMVASL